MHVLDEAPTGGSTYWDLLLGMAIYRNTSGSSNKYFIALLFASLFALTTISSIAQSNSLPPHQPLGIRHVCAPVQVSASPGQSVGHWLHSGEEVQLQDITFGPDNKPYFSVKYATGTGLQRATGFLPIDQVSNFCDFEKRAANGQNFLAPPNTCHLVAVEKNSIAALNKEASAFEKYRASMAAYRMSNGNYALSLGLLNIRASETILRLARELPANSKCSTGAEFVEALVKTESAFSDEQSRRFATDAQRLAAARGMMQQGEQTFDATVLKQACDLGASEACNRYAEAIYNAEDTNATLPATVTHYALMGCMGGNVLGCKLAINRAENTLENAQFRAIDGGTGNPDDLVGLELAKPGCDAQQAVSCVLLARGTAPYAAPTLIQAASNFAATLTACRTGIAWACEELQDAFAKVVQARTGYASATPDENYALGSLVEEICTPGPAKPNVTHCKAAYLKYRDFLQFTKTSADVDTRIGNAKSFLEKGCAAGDPTACATQSRLNDYWPAEARNRAAARAIDLCVQQSEKDSICDGLAASLDPQLNAAIPAQRQVYDALIEKCKTDKTSEGPQACSSAVTTYKSLQGDGQSSDIEAELAGACNAENINGCNALASLIAEKSQEGSQDAKDAVLSVLRTGCRFDDSPGSTCLSLADSLASSGDSGEAIDVYARTCEYQIKHAAARLKDVSICYNAAKFALAQKVHYSDALRWAEFSCGAEDLGLSPYACKLAGNIYASGLGVEANPQEAVIAYQSGCFHPFVKTTDGESCIKYGNILMDALAQLGQNGAPKVILPGNMYDDTENPMGIGSEASRAYDMGCMDSIEQACQLNRKLLDNWSNGRYFHSRVRCRVQDDSGIVRSDKTCRAFPFYQAAGELKEQRNQVRLDVYVWPDGDRTVVYQKDGNWLLNELVTDGVRRDRATSCWRNPVSKRSFCVTAIEQ